MIYMISRVMERLVLDGEQKFRIAFDGVHLHGAGKDLYFFSAQL